MPVAVVTGSNKGIGLGVVRALCLQYQGEVYLTSRHEARGREAVASLNREGLHPRYHVLDIEDEARTPPHPQHPGHMWRPGETVKFYTI